MLPATVRHADHGGVTLWVTAICSIALVAVTRTLCLPVVLTAVTLFAAIKCNWFHLATRQSPWEIKRCICCLCASAMESKWPTPLHPVYYLHAPVRTCLLLTFLADSVSTLWIGISAIRIFLLLTSNPMYKSNDQIMWYLRCYYSYFMDHTVTC